MRSNKKLLISTFLDKTKNLSKKEILDRIEAELSVVAVQIKENKHNFESNDFKDLMKYFRHLKSFRYLLENEEKDLILRDKEYKRFEWICEKLVVKGELNPKVRLLFI